MEANGFSERLLMARQAKGLTQMEMAQMLGLKQQTYHHYEHGREMKASMIVKACAILECSPSWLIGAEDEGQHLAPESPLLMRLKEAFELLNSQGQKKVAGYAEDLTGNMDYRLKITKKEPAEDNPLPEAVGE